MMVHAASQFLYTQATRWQHPFPPTRNTPGVAVSVFGTDMWRVSLVWSPEDLIATAPTGLSRKHSDQVSGLEEIGTFRI